MKEYFKNRYNILIIFFVLFGAVIVFQLVNLQIIHGQEYDELSQKKLLKESSIPAPRGNILDRYGVPLATNRIGYTAEIVKTKMKDSERDDMILRLVKIFEKNGDTYVKSLSKYLTFNPIDYGTQIKGSEKKIQKWKSEMAVNEKDIALMTTPRAIFDYFRNKKFKIDSKYSDEDAYKIMCIRYELLIRGYSSVSPLCLAEDIKAETVAEIEERHQDFPGVTTDTKPYRKYVDGETAANVMGFIGKIKQEEYDKLKDDGYKLTDIIGKTGIEASAEAFLKGKEGRKKVEVDITGHQTGQLEADPAIPGNNVILTLDMKLQKVAMESLKKNIELIKQQADGKKNFGDASAGAAVAMDVNTGEVLAMASYPSYDPSVFLESASNQQAQKTIDEYNNHPKDGIPVMINRAIQGTYAPGSTFKPITGITGLEEGAITPKTIINDSGTYEVGNMIFKCLEYKMGLGAHGDLTLTSALETSCNIYFHKLGIMVGIDNIDKWAKMFGLGEYTGIDIPNEEDGILASRKSKEDLYKRLYGKLEKWYQGDTAQAAIGQSFNLFTPLQMVDYTAALANGGKKIKPTLIKKVLKSDGSVVLEKKPEYTQIPVKKETLEAIKEGMKAVTQDENGTAVEAFRNFPKTVAGKTGTAETGGESNNKSSNALFICYAPVENPQIAVAVVIEHGAWGSNVSWVARDILSEYFGLSSSNSTDGKLEPEEVRFTH